MFATLKTSTADAYRMSVSVGTPTWDDILPLQTSLVGPVSPEWILVRPLTVTLEFGDDALIVSDDLFAIYGTGSTVASAVRDFLAALSGYYEVLAAHDDPETTKLLNYLQTYLQPTSKTR
jgi:hypothetical protein